MLLAVFPNIIFLAKWASSSDKLICLAMGILKVAYGIFAAAYLLENICAMSDEPMMEFEHIPVWSRKDRLWNGYSIYPLVSIVIGALYCLIVVCRRTQTLSPTLQIHPQHPPESHTLVELDLTIDRLKARKAPFIDGQSVLIHERHGPVLASTPGELRAIINSNKGWKKYFPFKTCVCTGDIILAVYPGCNNVAPRLEAHGTEFAPTADVAQFEAAVAAALACGSHITVKIVAAGRQKAWLHAWRHFFGTLSPFGVGALGWALGFWDAVAALDLVLFGAAMFMYAIRPNPQRRSAESSQEFQPSTGSETPLSLAGFPPVCSSTVQSFESEGAANAIGHLATVPAPVAYSTVTGTMDAVTSRSEQDGKAYSSL